MKRRRGPILLAATLFGIIVWVAVSMREQYQVTLAVPLTIENVPEGQAIESPVPRALQLKLRSDGWRLASLLLGPEMKLVLPVRATRTGRRAITFNDVAERIAMRPGIQLVDVAPETVFIDLDRWAVKKVPVVVDAALQFKDGYGQVGPAVVLPESVIVEGAESVLRTITSWKTVPASFDRLKAPVEADVALAPSATYILLLSTTTVHVRINVEPFAEKVFGGLPVEVQGSAQNREVILVPPKIEVVARAGIKQLSGLSAADFRVAVRYSSITSDTTGVIDPEVTAPSGVQVVSKKPERLQYILRKRL